MIKSKQAAKSVTIIIIFTIAGKFLGYIREALIAAKFGSSAETDTFFIALTATSLFATMITASINTTMIPVLSEIGAREGKKGKRDHTNNLLNIVMTISFVLIVLAWLLAPFIIKVLANGFKGEQFKLAVLMTRIGLPVIFFAGIVGVFDGYLQSELMFTESAVAQLPFNFVYIFFLIFLSGLFGIKGLVVASVLAVGAQALIQIPGVRKTGFKYNFVLTFGDKYTRKIIYLVPPVLISVAIGNLNAIIDRSLASTLISGSISALNYANMLSGLIINIFISAVAIVIFPLLSQEASEDNHDGLKKTITYGINIILLVTIPAMIGMMVLANPIVKVALERGAFDSVATHMTVGALIFYSVGLVGAALNPLLNRVYYSLQDMKTPMINGIIAVVINIILNFALINSMAHRGLALATSISAIITSLLLLYGLKKKIGSFGFAKSVKCGLKSLTASVIMGVIIYFLNSALTESVGGGTMLRLVVLLVSVGVGALIYFMLIHIFRIDEVDWIIKVVRDKLGEIIAKVQA